MASQLKLRRGSTIAHNSFTGASGELTMNTDTQGLVTHDGITSGGFPQLLAADLLETTGSATIRHSTGLTVKQEIDKLHRGDDSLNDNSMSSAFSNYDSILLLGDSITEGVGAGTYTESCAWLAGRSIINATDYGWPNVQSYGYHGIINMSNALATGLLSTTGSLSATGVVSSRLSLAAGQTLTLTGVSVDFADLIYDASVSTGAIEVRLNGTLIDTNPVAGVGLQTTFPTNISTLSASGALTKESDVITFTSVGGTIVVTDVLHIRNSYASPFVYVAAKSGTAYQDYTSSTSLDELAYYLNLFRTANKKFVLLNLGTNNIYSPDKALTPASMIAQIALVIVGLTTRCTDLSVAIAVPPKAYEATWPVILSGYTYEDYVDAIVAYATTNNYALIRHDQSVLGDGTAAFYSDGVHPNSTGHTVAARNICRTLGIPVTGYIKNAYNTASPPAEVTALLNGTQVNIPMADTWGPASGNAAYTAKARKVGSVVYLSGLIQPNGSAITTVAVLPNGYFSTAKGAYVLTRNSVGVQNLFIDTGGAISVDAIAGTWVSLENIAISL